MAQCGMGNCPPPPPRPGRAFVAFLCIGNGTLECPPQEDPHPYQDLPGGFLKHLRGGSLLAVDHRTQFHDRVGGPNCGRGVGAQMEPVVCHNARA